MSGAFISPAPCCRGAKEPFFFLGERNFAKLLNATARYRRRSGQLLLDFTPNYLHRAVDSIPFLKRHYGLQPPRFAVLLRDPVARARSMYCMWAPSPKSIAKTLLDGSACEISARGVAYCWSAFKEYVRDANLTERAVAQQLPAAANLDGTLNRSRAILQVRHGGLAIRELFLPWTLPTCASAAYDDGWGWGWRKPADDFASLLTRQIFEFAHGGRHPECTLTPPAMQKLELSRLRSYVKMCASASGFDLAGHSVPFMQLLLFLREFPTAEWTFIRHERLFSLPDEQVEPQLASIFGLHIVKDERPAAYRTNTRCRFRSGSRVGATGDVLQKPSPKLASAAALLHPWYEAVLQLATAQPNATLLL